jgi:hypothetical protein
VLALVAVLAAAGCSSQRILASRDLLGANPGAEFKSHGYSWYLFFGTIRSSRRTCPT